MDKVDRRAVVRTRLLRILQDGALTPRHSSEVLQQCQSFVQNGTLLRQTAKKIGLRLLGSPSDSEVLELYYDIKRGNQDIGYISKGWADPGFRIGDLIDTPSDRLTAPVLKILLNFFAVQGVAFTLLENTASVITIEMDSVVYTEGFNDRVFQQVIESLELCKEKARKLLRLET